ncbi:MAG: AMP-binding protein [Gammaproteobacteria bacterium]|nr:AMP-binding protein [Gammaproteobacteria bacterium]
MSEKPWLDAYPPGVPAEIDPDQHRSLIAFLESRFEQFADRAAFTNRNSTLTFADVDRLSRAMAAYLQAIPGLGRGDRVAVMMPNLLQTPITLFAVLRAGMVVVNVNPLYTARELEHQLNDSGARVIVVLENFADTVMRALPHTDVERVIVTTVGDHFPLLERVATNFVVRHVKKLVPKWDIPDAAAYRDVLAEGEWHTYERPDVGPDDIAFLQYTGGTTGVAKGAELTHRNMLANTLQAAAWARPFFSVERGVVITPLPLYHVYSLTANLFCFVELGGHDVLITDPRDMRGFVAELKKRPFAFMTGVNTLFNALLHAPGLDEVDFSSLRVCMGGGMAVHRDVAERWQAATGVAIAQGYGLTEASPIVTANPLDQTAFNGSVGVPLPSTDVAIFDDHGQRLGPGEIGEICAKGPQVMAGYWQRPEETEKVFYPDGWLRTGDLGRMDDQGYVFIEDRKKDVIVVSGFKVYPNEVEDVVAAHPGVLEAAAVGVPDEQSGEVVKLFVVRKDPALTEQEVIAHCRRNLTGYKIPQHVEFIGELPKSNVGKVLRRELKSAAASTAA